MSIVEDGPDLFSLHKPTTDAPFRQGDRVGRTKSLLQDKRKRLHLLLLLLLLLLCFLSRRVHYTSYVRSITWSMLFFCCCVWWDIVVVVMAIIDPKNNLSVFFFNCLSYSYPAPPRLVALGPCSSPLLVYLSFLFLVSLSRAVWTLVVLSLVGPLPCLGFSFFFLYNS